MQLPFSADAFLAVFARYNAAVWPMAAALWLAAAAALVATVVRPDAIARRWMAAVIAGLWAWGGIVYHAVFFTAINPAAWIFALLFVAEGVLVWDAGLRRRSLAFGAATGASSTVGIALAAYALAYPGLAVLTSHAYPATPTFGVPCPTGIYTIGMLLTLPRPAPLVVIAVPVIWGIIGGSAAIVLGVTVDYVLLVSAPLLFVQRIVTRSSSTAVAG